MRRDTRGAGDGGALEVPERGSFRGLSDAPLVARQVGFEQLSFWLNPISTLMTIAFSVVFLILLGATAGAISIVSSYGHIRLIDYYVAGFCAYGVMAACFTILAITLVNRRETGLLKRLRLSPLPTWMAMAALLVNAMIIATLGVVLLLVVGRVGYGVHGPVHWLPFIVTLAVAMLCYSTLGVGISTLVPNQELGRPDDQPDLLHPGRPVRAVVPHRAGFGVGQLCQHLPHSPPDQRAGRLVHRAAGSAAVALARPWGHGHLGRGGGVRRASALELVAQTRVNAPSRSGPRAGRTHLRIGSQGIAVSPDAPWTPSPAHHIRPHPPGAAHGDHVLGPGRHVRRARGALVPAGPGAVRAGAAAR